MTNMGWESWDPEAKPRGSMSTAYCKLRPTLALQLSYPEVFSRMYLGLANNLS